MSPLLSSVWRGLLMLALCAPFGAVAQPASADAVLAMHSARSISGVGFLPAAAVALDDADAALHRTTALVGVGDGPRLDALAAAPARPPVGLQTTSPDVSVADAVAHALGVATPRFEWFAEARDLVALADTVRSPLDTLRMSPWERVWWGRRGVMRQVGLFPTHPDQPLDDLRQVAQVRRKMLKWHQTLGLVTVASMGTTVVAGQLAASGHGKGFHEATLPLTIGLYTTTAALALLSPPKPITLGRGGGIDSITIHRWLAVAHVAGMLVTPLLGEDADTAHYVMGYATFATFSAAMLTVTLLRR